MASEKTYAVSGFNCRIALALQTSFTKLFIGNTLPEESILSVESLSSQISDQRAIVPDGMKRDEDVRDFG